MSYAFRGRRVAYDNVANGSATGFENHHLGSSATSTTSFMGSVLEQVGSITNVGAATTPGVEDYALGTSGDGHKFTSEGEIVG